MGNEISGGAPATPMHSDRYLIAHFVPRNHAEGNTMTDKTQKPDMRDSHRTDASRAAEKEAGEVSFGPKKTASPTPQKPVTQDNAATSKP